MRRSSAPRTGWTHPGSVGRPLVGVPHILDAERPTSCRQAQLGEIYYEGGYSFEYLKDDAKTAAARDPHGWVTVGDIGYLDDDGYLYLTDRRHHMIISGGVNIYPQEAEDLLITHPKVLDAAVFGIPGRRDGPEPSRAWCRRSIPADANDGVRRRAAWPGCGTAWRTTSVRGRISFEPQLPRTDTGKLYKQELVDKYSATNSRSAVAAEARSRARRCSRGTRSAVASADFHRKLGDALEPLARRSASAPCGPDATQGSGAVRRRSPSAGAPFRPSPRRWSRSRRCRHD